jgi:hypothetical protein
MECLSVVLLLKFVLFVFLVTSDVFVWFWREDPLVVNSSLPLSFSFLSFIGILESTCLTHFQNIEKAPVSQ